MLPNKFYRLPIDVPNPEPDRRRKDKRSAPVWVAGTVVFLRANEFPLPGDKEGTYTRLQLEFVGQSYAGQYALNPYEAGFKAIDAVVGDLEPVEEDFALLFFRLDHGGRYLLECLYDIGKITLKDIEDALHQVEARPDNA